MWKSVFGEGARVYGCDINPKIGQISGNATQIFVGDQADPAFWAKVKKAVPRVDIFIDDGGHLEEQMLVTLDEMLPHLSPDGVYIVEDVHGDDNAFWKALAFEKNIAFGTGLASNVGSLHVYPFLLVLERAQASEAAMQLHLGNHPSEVKLHLPEKASDAAESRLVGLVEKLAPGVTHNTEHLPAFLSESEFKGLVSMAVKDEFPQLPKNAWLMISYQVDSFEFGESWANGSDGVLKLFLSDTQLMHAPSMLELNDWNTAGGMINELQRSLDSWHMYPGLVIMQGSDGSREKFVAPTMGTEWITR